MFQQISLFLKIAFFKVHLPNGGFNVVRYGDTVEMKQIIQTVTERLSTGERYYNGLYAMRLSRPPSTEVAKMQTSKLLHGFSIRIFFRCIGYIKI